MPLRSYLGGRLFGDLVGGPAPLLIGLHGWGRDHHDLEAGVGDYPRLLMDLPGFGVSPPPPEAWGAVEYAACVAAAIDELGQREPVLIVGHSFGGRVAVCLAASRPDLVRGMILCGVPLLRSEKTSSPPVVYRLGRRAHRLGLLSDRRFEAMRRGRGSDDYNAASGVMRGVLVRTVNESYDQQLRAVVCPVGLLWGSRDQAVPASTIEKVSGLLSTLAAVEIVDGAGHDVHLQAPGSLGAMIEKILEAPRTVPC